MEGERGRWKLASPLGSYRDGTGPAGQQGAATRPFPGPPLSASQRSAAEAFWGSAFGAVQGPPGTGKTRLDLASVRRGAWCAKPRRCWKAAAALSLEQLLITSSNNRAVDNVVEPLGAVDGLALALRAGSRQSSEQQLLVQLRRALAWLKRAAGESALERSAQLTREKALFSGTARRDRTPAGPTASRARARESAPAAFTRARAVRTRSQRHDPGRAEPRAASSAAARAHGARKTAASAEQAERRRALARRGWGARSALQAHDQASLRRRSRRR